MSRNKKIIISFIILIIGITLFTSEYFKTKKIEVYDYMNEMYYNETIVINEEITEINEEIENNEEENVEDTSYEFVEPPTNYIGYLSIPNINLRKGFTTKEDKNNIVSKNVQILSNSDYPDTEYGNVILAAHSGNSSVSFFNKLYLLNKGDLAYIEYNNIKYTYKIIDIYFVPKTGKAEIKRIKNNSTLTLVTCTKDDKTTQTIYTLELIGKE